MGKTNDTYICVVSAAHCVAAKGKWIAIASTEVETDDPIKEISPALSLLEPILERFDECVDRLAPKGQGADDNCYISKVLVLVLGFVLVLVFPSYPLALLFLCVLVLLSRTLGFPPFFDDT